MKKLRIILQSKLFLLLIIFLTVIISSMSLKKDIPSFIDNNYIIKHIKIVGNKITITTNNILINYYVNTLDDLAEFKNTYKIGDIIKVKGSHSIPNDNTNFNLFNYRLYLRSKKIYYLLKADKITLIKHSDNFLYKVKNDIINKIDKYNNNYLYAFILGDNNYLDNDIKLSFKDNGISHLFAISGMHVTLLSLIILTILNKIKKTNINYAFVIIFLFYYAFLTNFTPSILRATSFFILIYLNKIFKLNINNIYLFIYLTCSFIIYNPYLIYNMGFLFSFSISFFLIVFGSITNKYHNYFIKLFITSLISFIGSIPILINNFSTINILTPIINLLFVPYVSFIIFPLSLITFLIPIFSPLLNITLNILEFLSLNIAKYSVNMILPHMNIFFTILYYIVIVYILFKFKKYKYQYIFILLILLLIHSYFPHLSNEIHFIDVGQGDSILLRLKNKNILIDTGGKVSYGEEWKRSNYSIAINTLIPYMKSFGVKKIDYLILSHGDFDHMGEAINLINNFVVEKVIFNCGPYNNLESELISILDNKFIKYDTCINELLINKDKLEFIKTEVYDNENDNSNVIYTELNNYKFMFMGDASSTTEKEILNKYNIPNIDVLKVGHHGSKTSSSTEFINKINPKYSIISVGKNNKYGHPNKETLNNLEYSKIYRTDEDGSIMIKIKNNKLKIETCSP